MDIIYGQFVWDERKEDDNVSKHGIDFLTASRVFFDPHKLLFIDSKHSGDEERLFCVGEVEGRVVTVRFTYRERKVRLIGAGFWRKGRKIYEKEKNS